jgi:SAM-dependent methyltransferase
MTDALPLLYGDLAGWFHLLTAPAGYEPEAALATKLIRESVDGEARTLLELGSGGGNNASHLKASFACTLTDLSPEMLALSRSINPDCEHLQGDMRTLRLGRTFDGVYVHDAIMYMTTEADLAAAFETAFVHTRPGGVAIFVPDCVRESFEENAGTRHGGHDGQARALRYLQWTTDPDPKDATYDVDFAIVLHEDGRVSRAVHDHHVFGLFPRETWLSLLGSAGFEASSFASGGFHGTQEVFVARKPMA